MNIRALNAATKCARENRILNNKGKTLQKPSPTLEWIWKLFEQEMQHEEVFVSIEWLMKTCGKYSKYRFRYKIQTKCSLTMQSFGNALKHVVRRWHSHGNAEICLNHLFPKFYAHKCQLLICCMFFVDYYFRRCTHSFKTHFFPDIRWFAIVNSKIRQYYTIIMAFVGTFGLSQKLFADIYRLKH